MKSILMPGYELLKEAISQKPTIDFRHICINYFINKMKTPMYVKDYEFFVKLHRQENCKPFVPLCNFNPIFNIHSLKTLFSTTWIIDKESCKITKINDTDLPDIKWGGQGATLPNRRYMLN